MQDASNTNVLRTALFISGKYGQDLVKPNITTDDHPSQLTNEFLPFGRDEASSQKHYHRKHYHRKNYRRFKVDFSSIRQYTFVLKFAKLGKSVVL